MVPYWLYQCTDGEVAIYIPRGGNLTVERANVLLDYAKQKLLEPEFKHKGS